MSHTLHPLRKPRLQRSELAVPGSNPTMIDKAAASPADFIFLDIEDAVAPPDKDRARKNIIQALNDIDWRAKGKTMSVRINGARRFQVGTPVKLGFDMTLASLFDAESELRI